MSGSRLSVRRLAAVFIVLAAIAGIASPAHAQVTRRQRRESNANRRARIAKSIEDTYSHRWEVAGGGGFLRFRSGEFNQKNDEVTWATSAAYNFNPKLSVVGDIRGAYGNAKIYSQQDSTTPVNGIYRPLITEYTMMAGPQWRFYAKQRWTVTGNILGGVTLGNFDGGTKGIPAPTLGMWQTSNRAAFSANVNLDYNIYPNLAARLTPTYVGTTYGGDLQNNLGFNVGIVYRFGRIKK